VTDGESEDVGCDQVMCARCRESGGWTGCQGWRNERIMQSVYRILITLSELSRAQQNHRNKQRKFQICIERKLGLISICFFLYHSPVNKDYRNIVRTSNGLMHLA